MACLFEHNWGWPRRRGGKDVQVCLTCGSERESKVHFGGPHYRRTQDPIPNFVMTRVPVEESVSEERGRVFAILAA
jgi:hypothetical protein